MQALESLKEALALKGEKRHGALKYQEITDVVRISSAAEGKGCLCQLNTCSLDDLIILGPVQGQHP